MDFDIVKLLQDCIKKYNLDPSELRDIAFAICISEKTYGSNNKSLDIDKMCTTDIEIGWNNVLRILDINPVSKGYKALPRVQKLRIISDVLTLKLSNEVDDLFLTYKSSEKVAKKLGLDIRVDDNCDESTCLKNLEKIRESIELLNFDGDSELIEILNMLEDMNITLDKKISLQKEYLVNDYRKNNFVECRSDKFIKRIFIQSLNCLLLDKLMSLDESKWISLYDIFDTIADYMNHEKIVCCVTQDIRSNLAKCHRLNNSILLVGKYSYSVYDYRFTKILLVSMYSRNLIEALNKYITK